MKQSDAAEELASRSDHLWKMSDQELRIYNISTEQKSYPNIEGITFGEMYDIISMHCTETGVDLLQDPEQQEISLLGDRTEFVYLVSSRKLTQSQFERLIRAYESIKQEQKVQS